MSHLIYDIFFDVNHLERAQDEKSNIRPGGDNCPFANRMQGNYVKICQFDMDCLYVQSIGIDIFLPADF